MQKLLTTITPIVRPDLVERMLETLHQNTDNIFYSIVIDQTKYGLDMSLRDKFKDLIIIRSPITDVHYTGNLGFAQATNLGIKLVETPYFMMVNDDVEFLHPGWWDGVLDTFKMVEKATPDRPAVIVNPASMILADWSVGRAAGAHHFILPYKENYTNEDWEFLVNEDHYVNEHLTIKPGSVFDGVTLYASVAHTERFLEIGYLDERYHPGSGEDYCYSCLASMRGYRSVSTTLSWILHHWSKSFEQLRDKEEIQSLRIPELAWNHNHEKWGPRFDIWGVKCETCKSILYSDDGLTASCPNGHETYTMPQNTKTPL